MRKITRQELLSESDGSILIRIVSIVIEEFQLPKHGEGRIPLSLNLKLTGLSLYKHLKMFKHIALYSV